MMRRITFLALVLVTFLVAVPTSYSDAQPPDRLTHYRFVPWHSTLRVQGGIAGFDIRANIFGEFDLINGYLQECPVCDLDQYAAFRNVDAEAINPADFGPYSFDLDDTLNLSGLFGYPLPVGAPFDVFKFEGRDGFGAPMHLFVVQLGRWLYMKGENEPPCCDFFDYEIRALARRAPFPDFTHDDRVDGDDLAMWSDGHGDADDDGDSDGQDFLALQQSYGEEMPSIETFEAMAAVAEQFSAVAAVPEPHTLGMMTIASLLVLPSRRP